MLGEFVEDKDATAPQDAASATLLTSEVEDLLDTLTPRERRVLQLRFGLIDEALAPLSDPHAAMDAAEIAQLRKDLVAVVSAEALFVLTDLAGLAPEEAIASLVRTATTITEAALREDPTARSPLPR